ncbi:sensor histidine kinase [Mycolicibacterium phlei]
MDETRRAPAAHDGDDPADDHADEDAARRHLLRHANSIAVLMRHSANLIVAVTILAVPHSVPTPAGTALLVSLGCWAIYRLVTRSPAARYTAVDYALTLAVCFAIPLLVSDPAFHTTNSAPIAIAGTAVISFSVSLPARCSALLVVGVAVAYAFGAAPVVGPGRVGEIFNLYYFALQWVTSALIRLMVLRVAEAVDTARSRRQDAEIAERVNSAVRDYDREQVRLLHDTVASTLLLVGQGTPLPADRLAAQARRDLDVLGERWWTPAPDRLELVATLRKVAAHLRTPQRWTGLGALWLDGRIAQQVAASVREAVNNVDRHAGARTVTIDVSHNCVTISDDGRGFDPAAPQRGTGIARSIRDRMDRIAGTAEIASASGRGTVVELHWPDTLPGERTRRLGDTDRLIARTRVVYGLALTAYAVVNLAALAGQAATTVPRPAQQLGLAFLAATTTVLAVPAVLGRFRVPPWPSTVVLMGIAVAQTILLPAAAVGTQAQWSQGAVGWCLLPYLLSESVRRASILLTLAWVVPALVGAASAPSADSALNIGLGTASILCVQLFALLFNGLIRDAAEKARAQTAARVQSAARERISAAVHEEYRRRYATLLAGIFPVLTALALARPLDAALRSRARAESRKLRALFDQPDTFDHPLLQLLRTPVGVAEDSGVEVSVHVNGDLPMIEGREASRIVTRLTRALSAARDSARITITADDSGFTTSIVCHGLENGVALDEDSSADGDHVEVVATDDMLWLTIRHEPASSPDPAPRSR